MLKEICKRDGRIVPFRPEKITEAIFKAAQAVGGEDRELAEKLTGEVIKILEKKEIKGLIPSVEEIQDNVEKVLIEKGHARTAKAYILYRDKRTRIRETKSELMEVVREILLETEGRENEESWSPHKKMFQIAGAVSKKYYLENLLPEEMIDAHNQGKLYIYGLHYYSKAPGSYFFSGDTIIKKSQRKKDLFGDISLTGHYLRNLQEELYQELTFPNFDSFFRKLFWSKNKKKLSLSSPAYCVETLLNSLTAGKNYSNLPVSFNVGLDTNWLGREACMALLELYEQNNYRNMNIVFQTTQQVNRADNAVNHDLYVKALKMARDGRSISFAFLDNSFNNKKKVAYSSSSQRRHLSRDAGMGSVAALGINLPLLAFSTKNVDLFFVELDRLLRFAALQLIHRLEVLSHLKVKDLPLIQESELYGKDKDTPGAKDNIGPVLRRGTLDLRFYGLKELYLHLPGWEGLFSSPLELTEKVVGHIKRRSRQFTDDYNLNFALSLAPGKRASHYFKKKNLEQFSIEEYSTKTLQEEEIKNLKWDGYIQSSFLGGHVSHIRRETSMSKLDDAVKKGAACNLGLVKVEMR